MEWVENIGHNKVIVKAVHIETERGFRQKTIKIDTILRIVDLEELQVSTKKHELADKWKGATNSGYEDQLPRAWEKVWTVDWGKIVDQLNQRESVRIGQGKYWNCGELY